MKDTYHPQNNGNKEKCYSIIIDSSEKYKVFPRNTCNRILTLPHYISKFKLEKKLGNNFKIDEFYGLENQKPIYDKILKLSPPSNIKHTYILNEELERWLLYRFRGTQPNKQFNLIYADFCGGGFLLSKSNIIYDSLKDNGIFAITENQRLPNKYKFMYNNFKNLFEEIRSFDYAMHLSIFKKII